MRAAIGDLTPMVGVRAACEAFDFPRASFYRKRVLGVLSPAAAAVRFVPRALVSAEREAVLACLHEERFQNSAPAAVYATLLDEGRYHCSIRTMYRILESEGEVRERRDQLVHPAYTKPELLATGPNQLWSWDITKLLGPAKWTYFYLYVILDVFSRYVVGWMVADGESSELAKRLIADTCGETGDRAGEADDSCGPGFLDDIQTRRLSDGGSGDHQNPQPPACLRRQPVFGKPLPDSEIPARVSRNASGLSRMPVPSPRSSSPGTTKSTAIPDWAFSLRLWFITVWRRKPLSGGAPFSTPPTALIPSASSASRRNRCPRRRRSGSTNHNKLQRIKLSKLCFRGVSNTLTRAGLAGFGMGARARGTRLQRRRVQHVDADDCRPVLVDASKVARSALLGVQVRVCSFQFLSLDRLGFSPRPPHARCRFSRVQLCHVDRHRNQHRESEDLRGPFSPRGVLPTRRPRVVGSRAWGRLR